MVRNCVSNARFTMQLGNFIYKKEKKKVRDQVNMQRLHEILHQQSEDDTGSMSMPYSHYYL